ncbi:NAD-glutamate dehydrogenase domain-containing protein [Gordonia paraffinivorans]|uniref:NAD-glutamate dehydrogenase domain-containing protein n=1 Tax=Gordonia paraffinivorans TaxID=175628 RepID=UPI0035E3E964
MAACVRTNCFQRADDGSYKRHASFKLDSARLTLRGPVGPRREIYVHSADVEGIHARSGDVARGRLRFSSRPEDYRTEVLGLTKTQMVKNSPIVPRGCGRCLRALESTHLRRQRLRDLRVRDAGSRRQPCRRSRGRTRRHRSPRRA